MSIEKPLRDMVQQELRVRFAPIHKAIARMDDNLEALESLRELLERLTPLSERLEEVRAQPRQQILPGLFSEQVAVPRRAASLTRGVPARLAPAREEAEEAQEEAAEARAEAGVRLCAVIGCRRPARSKGYCSAHYQKLRLLVKTGRRPASWVDDAGPHSVPEVVLPRGRAAQRREEEPQESLEPAEPPKPKVWVRRKGASEKISLV